MRLPHRPFRQKFQKSSKQDEVFAEASELASLRLEQCIADLRISVTAVGGTIRRDGIQSLRKYTNVFLVSLEPSSAKPELANRCTS
jgi:hypothetical protein